jgi:hypothetical protein
MKARLVLDRRVVLSEIAFIEMKLWLMPMPVRASVHSYKYRLAFVANGKCEIRFDNESGKGDHKHIGDAERPYIFAGPDKLVADFLREVTRWQNENSDT